MEMKYSFRWVWIVVLFMIGYLFIDANFCANDCGSCCPDMHFIFEYWNPPYTITLTMAGVIYIEIIIVLAVLLIWEEEIQRSRKTKGEKI